MSWGREYAWITNFWRDVIAQRPGRTWVLATLFDGDLMLRDALAHAVIREQLRARGDNDVVHRFVRAWSPRSGPGPSPNEDVIFLGRTKPFTGSNLWAVAAVLEQHAQGRFMDPSNGTTGNAIGYGQRLFSRRDLEDAPPEPWRRCDRDYGVLLYWHLHDERSGAEHRLLAISGLGTLGTLGLTLILADERRREEFRRQVRELAPRSRALRPAEATEICVRIQVAGEAQLANFLNAPDFDFQVEAVAIAGGPVHLREETGSELQLISSEGRRGGSVRLANGVEVRLPPARFALLHCMVTHPKSTTPRDLCRALESSAPPRQKRMKPKGSETVRLAKLVHDLNASLRRIPGLHAARPVRFNKKKGWYVLEGARFALPRAPGPSRGAQKPTRPRLAVRVRRRTP